MKKKHLNSREVSMATSALFKNFSSLLIASVIAANANAALTDIADAPLTTSSNSVVLPNLMFVMDDSGSMNWEHLPDDAGDLGSTTTFRFGYYGLRSSQCNEIYYDPTITYKPPVDYAGNSYANASFTQAVPDGFKAEGPGNVAVALSTNFRASLPADYTYVAGDTTGQPAYYYVYSGTQTSEKQRDYNSTTNTFYTECGAGKAAGDNGANGQGNAKFTRVVVAENQQQNFANWYSYYRTRMLMMKTAAGLAFKSIDSKYRIGFMTINNNNGNAKDFVNIETFSSSQKNAWYAALYATKAGGSTPLREALSNAGKIYAGKKPTLYGNTVNDPVQYSCQQNFTLLSTDGYWNGNAGSKLDNSAIGNQDGGKERPYSDGMTTTWQMSTSQTFESKIQALLSTNQIEQRKTEIKQRVQQIQQRTVQNQQRTEQIRQSTSQTTNATTNIIITNVNSPNEVSVITINGVNRLAIPKVSGTGGNSNARKTSLAAAIADNLTGGYEATAFGTCTGSNNPVTGCSNGDRYVSIMAPAGSGNVAYTVSITSSGVSFNTISKFSGGATGTTSTGPTNVPSCTAGITYTGNKRTETTCTTTDTGWVNAGSCTPSSSGGQTVSCRVLSDTGFVNASSCTASNPASGPTVTCNTTDTGFQYASSCAPSGPAGGQTISCDFPDTGWVAAQNCVPSSSVGQTIECRTNSTGPTPVASCTPQNAAANNQWTQKLCDSVTVAAAKGVQSCTAVAPSAANNFVETRCQTVATGLTIVASCTPQAKAASNDWKLITCVSSPNDDGISDTLADVAEYYYTTDLRTATLGNCTGAVVPPATTGNTLCTNAAVDPYNNVPSSGLDSASWQHMTTFTLGLGARGRMIFSPSYLSDTSGDFHSVKNGKTATSTECTWTQAGRTCNWPLPGVTTENGVSTGKVENIDDLWHAAVNGRGTYFSATNPTSLSAGLSSALAGVTIRTGGTAAATTSSPNIVAGDNFVFSSNYTSGEWTGELFRFTLDPVTLQFSATNDWDARKLLDQKPYGSRIIYTYDPVTNANATTKLKSFVWDNLTDAEKLFFQAPHISTLSQLCTTGATCLPMWRPATAYTLNDEYRVGTEWYRVNTAYTSGATFGDIDTANSTKITGTAEANLVNFLRGDRTNEGSAGALDKYFRQRTHVLGDIINSEAVYIKSPHYRYVDDGYATYKTDKASRQGMVYVAANDGMLHAFKAGGETITAGDHSGEELWAYIPSLVLPNLYKLADKSYSNHHQYYVDGTPTQGDVKIGGEWRTILVGGLNAGGRGYYALDVTDPEAPKALWEFTYDTSKTTGYTKDANLGYSFGKPVITKLRDGRWVVLVTSGYNNGDGTSVGDGKGYLYVLNAGTGAIIGTAIGTGVGSATDKAEAAGCDPGPCASGLAQIAQWADNPTLDNTAQRVYGGDLFGNVWRFDINDILGPSGTEAHLMATLKGPPASINSPGKVQPITAKPVLGSVNGKSVVFIGTGRMLGESDLNDTSVQSIYAIKDTLGVETYGNPRDDTTSTPNTTGFVKQTLTVTDCPASSSVCTTGQQVRTGSNQPVDLSVNKGWYIDFPGSGERDNTDPQLALGTLAVNTNIPNKNACTAGGESYAYFFNYATGGPVTDSTKTVVGVKLDNGLTSRPVVVRSASGKVITINQVDGVGVTKPAGVDVIVYRPKQQNAPTAPGTAATTRVSWRELIGQ
jgi:type IV pilus assembly protein PilY1